MITATNLFSNTTFFNTTMLVRCMVQKTAQKRRGAEKTNKFYFFRVLLRRS
jgi:hypothetical protein